MTLRRHLNGFAGPAAFAASLAMAGPAAAQDHSHHGGMSPFLTQPLMQSAALGDGAPPLWDNLGTLHYPITTANPLAQAFFDQGLRLAYAFNHAEARRAFHHAQ